MFSSTRSPAASAAAPVPNAMTAPAGSAPLRAGRGHRPRFAGVRSLAVPLVAALALAMSPGPSSAEDQALPGQTGPDPADLRDFIGCSEAASTRLLSSGEAAACAHLFTRIKLSFVPGIAPEDFEGLAAREKAAVNLVGYQRYMDWLAENPAMAAALRHAPVESSDFAAN